MIKKLVMLAIETILFAIIVIAVLFNLKEGSTSEFVISLNGTKIIINTYIVIAFAYLFGMFSGLVYALVLGNRYRDQIEFYARKNEKLSQQNEIDTDNKEVLERKIATLEIALKNALKNKE